jgi:protein-disulfide isomerase
VKRLLQVLLLFLPVGCFGADEADQLLSLKRDIEALKRGQTEIRRGLQSLKDILTGRPPSLENVVVRIGDRPTLGSSLAKVALVEFSDFQCPFCGEYARQTFGRILDEYVKNGRIRYVARSFPLRESHPLAEGAAEAALCANEQGRYWEIHEWFFKHQQRLDRASIREDAKVIGLDSAAFERCLETGRYVPMIAKDVEEGQDLGIRGTPSFFLGYADANDPNEIRAIKSLSGALPFRAFQTLIEELLKVRPEEP